jgi:hypothetical protein
MLGIRIMCPNVETCPPAVSVSYHYEHTIKRVGLQSGYHYNLCKYNLFLPCYSWTIWYVHSDSSLKPREDMSLHSDTLFWFRAWQSLFLFICLMVLNANFNNFSIISWRSVLKDWRLSWPWPYGSWIYNYLCNECLSALHLWVRATFMARCIRYNIIW